ncbi:GTPase [Candidatus Vidania fulgoroideorum]
MNKYSIIGISTGLVNSGIGIIRISSNSNNFSKKIFFFLTKRRYFFPRLANKVNIYIKNKKLDDAILIYYPEPNSYNGESLIELHTHGNLSILKLIIKICLLKFKNLKLAKKGEFTYRAYSNGKINIFDVKEIERKLNSKNEEIFEYLFFKKKINNTFIKINNEILNLLLYIENFIISELDNNSDIKYIKYKLKKVLEKVKKIKLFKFRKKCKVVITGKTNVGKSSLFNKILEKNISIVYKKPGTTRNIIAVKKKFGNTYITLYDTAGDRKYKNKVEKIGIIKKDFLIKKSDINIIVEDKILNNDNNFQIKVINKIDILKIRKKFFKKKLFLISLKNDIGVKWFIKKMNNLIKKIVKKKNKKNQINKILFEYKIKVKKNIKSCIRNIKKNRIDLIIENLKKTQNYFGFFLSNKRIVKKILKNFCVGK